MIDIKDLSRDDALERIREAIDSFRITPDELFDRDQLADSTPARVPLRN